MDWTAEMEQEIVRLRDEGVSQAEIAQRINSCYGVRTTRDSVKNRLFRIDARDNLAQSIENKKLKDFEKTVGQYEITKDLIQDSVKGIRVPTVKRPKPSTNKTKPHETAVLCIGDCQIGRVTPQYNSKIFLESLENLTQKVLDVTKILRSGYVLDDLVVLLMGDVVDGQGIFATQAYSLDHNVVDQVFKVALPGFLKAINTLATSFPQITVYGVAGNHGRTGKELPLESNWDMVFYYALSGALRGISFDPTPNPLQIIKIRGKRLLLTHGDLIRSMSGQPAQSIINRALRWQQSVGAFDNIICGHFHHTIMNDFNNFELLINGTFLKGDEYALNNMGLTSSNKQLFFGMNEKHGITWRYKLDV